MKKFNWNFLSRKEEQPANLDMIHEVLWQNEIQANMMTARMMIWCGVVLLISMGLTAIGVFEMTPEVMYSTGITALIWHVVPGLICFYYKGKKNWLKYLLLFGAVVGQARVDVGLGYNMVLCILLPVVFSTRYYSFKLTMSMIGITTVVFSVVTYLGAVTGFTPIDLNFFTTQETYARDVMILSFLPRWSVFLLVAGVCAEIARRGRDMVLEQAEISRDFSRVETELNTASKIQLGALPKAEKLLAGHEEIFELVSSISPAKEVGGDFYDYFFIDPTHLALVMADVSGKGVPAALFMMVSKILLDRSASTGKVPHKVLAEVNHQLCEKNINDMFVTVWLGILDLTTGKLVCSNAGHEHPMVRRSDDHVEVIRSRHGMVLGGIDGAVYRDEVIQLAPGDTIFVYTDGIPEAHNPEEQMYGLDRLTAVLENNPAKSLHELVTAVKQDVDHFAGSAPQFDDTTMLALRMNTYMVRDGYQVIPTNTSIRGVRDYVTAELEKFHLSRHQISRLHIAVEEMYSNIVYHSGASWAEAVCSMDDEWVSVVLRDNGVPFNPIKPLVVHTPENPDLHHTNGVGMFVTRRVVDDISYRYEERCNELTMRLKLEK